MVVRKLLNFIDLSQKSFSRSGHLKKIYVHNSEYKVMHVLPLGFNTINLEPAIFSSNSQWFYTAFISNLFLFFSIFLRRKSVRTDESTSPLRVYSFFQRISKRRRLIDSNRRKLIFEGNIAIYCQKSLMIIFYCSKEYRDQYLKTLNSRKVI